MFKLSIVKIGGNVIEDDLEFSHFLELFSKLSSPKILVHGGGRRASEISTMLGIKPQLVQGRRITDNESLEVALMVYAGLLNKTIVAKLQGLDCNAIGLSGADGNTILAHKRPVRNIDFGFAGDVDGINNQTVGSLLKADLIPVFCALTHNGKGQMLNTNADTIASELAIGMSNLYEVTLYYCFEKKGVLKNIEDENSVIPHIDETNYPGLVREKIIANGMLPKLDNCFHALRNGVSEVCIGKIEMLKSGSQQFTTVTL